MPRRTRLHQPTYINSIVEWRFPKAHRYWDDCGKLISEIEREFPSLECEGLGKDGFSFKGRSGPFVSASFYWDKATLVQSKSVTSALSDACRRYWQLLSAVLKPVRITRLGQRTWIVYETPSVNDATEWLGSHKLWRFEGDRGQGLGDPVGNGLVLRTLIEPHGRRMRLEINSGTITTENRQRQGVLVDVDVVLEEPHAQVHDDVHGFVEFNLEFLRDNVEPLFRG